MNSCARIETEQVKFKTKIFNLSSVVDSTAFEYWKRKYLTQENQIPNDTLYALDSIAVGTLYYKDTDYKVYGYCMGEYGGALMFQDRHKPDSIYYLSCTCPLMIDKRKDGYYITRSLAHGDGSGAVEFIHSPKELLNLPLDSLAGRWEKTMFPELDNYEIYNKLENQGEILIDSMGLTFNIFFAYKDQNYLIYSDLKNTYLGSLNAGKLIAIDTLLPVPTWRYNDVPNNIINNFYHYNFSRREGMSDGKIEKETWATGDIYVRNDIIVIAYKITAQ